MRKCGGKRGPCCLFPKIITRYGLPFCFDNSVGAGETSVMTPMSIHREDLGEIPGTEKDCVGGSSRMTL